MKDIREKSLPVSVLESYPPSDRDAAFDDLKKQLQNFPRKIIVLDDDPTGVQTVHDIPVYTDWRPETIAQAFSEYGSMFFILTNSRSMTTPQTQATHMEIAKNIDKGARKTGKDFILISRSDSTLRGYYPLETECLRDTLESLGSPVFDGEIIYPFFMEGGRYTINDIHYVKEYDWLTPAAQTEFAQDKSFGYHHSYLPNWCEEKTQGAYRAEDVVCISLDDLRARRVDVVADQLRGIHQFGKVIVNSIDYADTAVFSAALIRVLNEGKRFMLRSAAAVTKVLGGVSDQPLLSKEQLIAPVMHNGGIILVGSHVNKTTQQLGALRESGLPLTYLEFDVRTALEKDGLDREAARTTSAAEDEIRSGRSVVIFTSRTCLDIDSGDKDAQVALSARISEAVTSVIGNLLVQPAFIIAKGGITSSDVGTKALRVRRAMVMGQVQPGIPVWMTGKESKFPGMPYIIFPGNVGGITTLRDIVTMLLDV
jgi:uncharacterized protein YgbK (DUF1537 family)